MLKQIPKLVLLVALLSAFVASSVPAFAGKGCVCFSTKPKPNPGGCAVIEATGQCISKNCDGVCAFF